MSSEHQSEGKDADDSPDRPNNASHREKDPVIDESDGEDGIARKISPSPPGSSRDRPDRSASSPPSEAPETRSEPAVAPQTESCGGSGIDITKGNSLFSWLQRRTIRRGVFVDPVRDNFRTMTSLYCSMNPAAESVNLSTQTHGAVFNLEYSPDG